MSIVDRITSNLSQTAVYWSTPTPTGDGGYTYDDAVEVQCRWESRAELYNDRIGRQSVSNAVVYVNQDLSMEGFLYLGLIDDLTIGELSDPRTIESAHMIKFFAKSPRLGSSTEFIRKAYL